MLTKEECVNAFNKLFNKAISANFYNGTTFLDACENQLEVFKKLIKEHFDNPPLSFEELKPEMWVWDNVDKEYRQIESKAKKDWVWFYINYRKEHVDEFYEKNRFYRKQVEE